ncbi:MAG: AarF/UbiB family protein [Chloroflexota bacterium]
MPNSTNPRSTSGSNPPLPADEPTDERQNGVDESNGNVRVLIDAPDADDIAYTDAITDDEAIVGEPVLPALAEESEARAVNDSEPPGQSADEEVQLQPPPPPPKPRISVDPYEHKQSIGRRSIRMQVRYLRSLAWAAQLFIRILFWQWVVKRIRGEEFVRRRNVQRWKQYAREFRDFAASMGGVFIKAGQFISTRADIFPEEIIMELAGLQDEIPAIPFKHIEKVIIKEVGEDYRKYFRWLRETPIAAASLGQVHRAQLTNGDRVVVKVQRPGIVRIVDTDLAALMVISHVAMRFKFISRRANAVEITEEFGRVLWEEVSYLHESQNLQDFARMFQNNLGIYVPMVYDQFSTDRLLIMEDVTSIKINDYEKLEEAGISRKEVARRLMNSYLQQVFDERFFHADPHPGNLFVYPLPVEDGQEFGPEGRPFYLIYIDFGMTGHLTEQIVDGLISTLIAIVTRDAHRLVQSYLELGLLLPGADVERIEQASKAAFDQVWGMSMTDLSNVDYEVMERLGNEFNDLLFDMPFRMPQNFIYLARTMGILSGMCTSLDPGFNPWAELQPYTEKMMRMRASSGDSLGSQLGSSLLSSIFGVSGASNIFEAGSQIITRAVAPTAVNNEALMNRLTSGEVKVTSEPGRKWEIQMHFMHIYIQTATRAVLFTGFLISSTLLLTSGWITLAIIGYIITAGIGWRVIFPPDVLQ